MGGDISLLTDLINKWCYTRRTLTVRITQYQTSELLISHHLICSIVYTGLKRIHLLISLRNNRGCLFLWQVLLLQFCRSHSIFDDFIIRINVKNTLP